MVWVWAWTRKRIFVRNASERIYRIFGIFVLALIIIHDIMLSWYLQLKHAFYIHISGLLHVLSENSIEFLLLELYPYQTYHTIHYYWCVCVWSEWVMDGCDITACCGTVCHAYQVRPIAGLHSACTPPCMHDRDGPSLFKRDTWVRCALSGSPPPEQNTSDQELCRNKSVGTCMVSFACQLRFVPLQKSWVRNANRLGAGG